MMLRTLAVLCLVAMGSAALAQSTGRSLSDALNRYETIITPTVAKPGDVVVWRLTLVASPGWHTYPTRQADANADSYVTRINWPKTMPVALEGPIRDPDNALVKEEGDIKELRYYEGTAVWEQSMRISADAANGEHTIVVPIRLTICDEHGCIPGTITSTVKLTITGGSAATPIGPGIPQPSNQADTESTDAADYKAKLSALLGQMQKLKAEPRSDLWSFLLTAMFWGGISLLTPCVFPMIPITVSFFLKQSEKNHLNPVVMALVYCATIVAVLGTASLTLLGFFTALSINPVTNVLIGVLFVVLALSLFGMYDLTLPNFLTRFTSAREGRGGLIGTIFMALTFTVVSFTCVAPFLGGFGGMAAQGQFTTFELILGAAAFSATFAAPFFLLALFPSLIRKLPKSGGWLHTVKVVMGFIELAAAVKFFRTAELVSFKETTLFTYDFSLGMLVVLMLVCGLYLVKLVRIGSDDLEEPGVGVPRLMFGLAFLTLALYLTPALFSGGPEGGNQRPRGAIFAWVDSFLLPDPSDESGSEMKWTGNLIRAIEEARAERQRTGKPSYVFIDFTGKSCPNCRLNEREVFTKSDVKLLFEKFKLVQLYTDVVPDQFYPPKIRSQFHGIERQQADAEINRWFQDQAFGSVQLPLYVILEPMKDNVVVVGVHDESKINNVSRFVEFLKKPFFDQQAVASR